MIQGWHNDAYLILFDDQLEELTMTERYSVSSFLPGFTVLGLTGWDHFILRDSAGACHTVPTVPLTKQYLKPFTFNFDYLDALIPDGRVTDKIKWHVQPIVFGGDSTSAQNMTWLTLDQHVEAVKWWNAKYQELH